MAKVSQVASEVARLIAPAFAGAVESRATAWARENPQRARDLLVQVWDTLTS